MTWAACILAICAWLPQDAVDEQIKEFEKYYKKRLSRDEKVEAIHVLEDCDRPRAAELLLKAAGDDSSAVRQAAVKVLSGYLHSDVRDYLVEVAGASAKTASGARSAAIEALGNIGSGAAIDVLMENLSDRDFEVKRCSLVALGKMRALQAVDAIIAVLEDKDVALHTAALDSLGRMKRPQQCWPPVAPMLEADDWQVRAAAIGAARRLRAKDSIGPLIEVLAREEGRLRGDALDALQDITGMEFHDDASLWRNWWEGIQERFEVPSEAEREKQRLAREENQVRYVGREAEFMGLPTKSRRIIFVIDVSGSMEDLIQNKKTFKLAERAYRSYQKMEIVKEELARAIESLGSEVRFNIFAFASKVKPWKKSLVPANVVNKKGAAKWIRSLKPIGGASQGFRARAGLGGSSGLGEGKTNTYEALMSALDAGGRGGFDKNYDSKVDTVFFLSDGVPTVGKYVEKDEILGEVQRVNELRKIVIHTITIGDMDHTLMKQIAEQNDGIFLDLGK